MGMPIVIDVVDAAATHDHVEQVFSYFDSIDQRFSTYKPQSEISKINRNEIPASSYSEDMKTVFALCEDTLRATHGYFDIRTSRGTYDPSGLVKGWSIYHAAQMLAGFGYQNFYVDAGGDIQVSGVNEKGGSWSIGIKNPFQEKEIVAVVYLENQGIATSGTYIRGQHVYNPKNKHAPITDVVSLTVIGPNVYEADRFATAAFAMGKDGIAFIEGLDGFEGFSIDAQGMGIATSGFHTYTHIHS